MTIRESKAFGLTDMRMTINRSGSRDQGRLASPFFLPGVLFSRKEYCPGSYLVDRPRQRIHLEDLTPGGDRSIGSSSRIFNNWDSIGLKKVGASRTIQRPPPPNIKTRYFIQGK